MRQIVLDTETTGLEFAKGHRVIEIGCVELVNRRPSGNTYHRYIQPDREIDPGAAAVHGITNKKLADEPRFAEIADEFIRFIADAELIIHNADFDVGFLDNELRLLERDDSSLRKMCRVTDTLPLARDLHPGQRNSLDALCKRYSVDNSSRDLHGALLDAQLLADVYLAMTGGQSALFLDQADQASDPGGESPDSIDRAGLSLAVVKANDAELAAHNQQLDLIDATCDGGALWRSLHPSHS